VDDAGCELVVYNAFSPNEDGNNDLWIIDGIGNHPNTITIYNRWEDVVQEFVNYDNKNVVWDGKNKNGKDVPDGTYFYVIKLETFSLHVENTITGWVQITNN
jgi:gliding motility-associated-like protein